MRSKGWYTNPPCYIYIADIHNLTSDLIRLSLPAWFSLFFRSITQRHVAAPGEEMKSLLYHPLRRIHHSMDHDSEEQKTYSGSTKINQPEFTLAFCRKFPYSATLSKIQGPLLNWKISHQEILAMPSRSENFFGGKKFSTGVSLTWIFSITSQSTNLRKKKKWWSPLGVSYKGLLVHPYLVWLGVALCQASANVGVRKSLRYHLGNCNRSRSSIRTTSWCWIWIHVQIYIYI